MIQREVFKGVNSIKFYNRFKSDEDCLKYLSEIKWPDEAFVCARCGNATYHKGRTPYSRRCNKCKHDESVTAGTMLDRMKLAPLFAFHIAFKIATKKKGMSSLELAEEYELRQKTVWEFKWKLQQAMKSSGKYPLTGNVHVDEFYIGGEEEGITGRSSESAKSSLSLHWKSLRMESAEHMHRLLMMLLPNHSDRFLQSIYPKMQKLSPTNGRAIYLLWTNTKLSSGNLKMASHSHKCTYTL